MEDQRGQMGDGTMVHQSLGQLRRVFADVAERGGRDAFERHLRLPETQQQQRDSTGLHHRMSQRCEWEGGNVKN